MAVHPEENLFVSECAYSPCSIPWAISRCCYRGHRYCSKACSQLARQEKKRQYNGRHQEGLVERTTSRVNGLIGCDRRALASP